LVECSFLALDGYEHVRALQQRLNQRINPELSMQRPCTFSFWWDTSSAQCGTIVYAVFVCLSMLHGWHGLVAEALFRAIKSVYITYEPSATPIADAER
jgi:hypothetical protein